MFTNVYSREECTFAPATIAPMVNANFKHNPNPNPNLYPYLTLNKKKQSLPGMPTLQIGLQYS